jgi:hypothetical protein
LSAAVVPLFNPRKDNWEVHFRFENTKILAITAIGRATVELLDLNSPRRQLIRRAEAQFGLFPP